jgi:transmembrane sensor
VKDEAVYADLIGQYLSGNISRDERAKLMAWVESSAANRTFFEDMVDVWSTSKEYQEAPFEANMDVAWAKIDVQTQLNIQSKQPQAKVVKMRNWRRMTSIAAAILVLMAAGWWYLSQPIEIFYQEIVVMTGENEQLEYTLPDSSVVWLNEHSQIAFVKNFEKRTIHLVGEAFFEVERMEESPFEIFSGNAKTRVLGTSFNVRAYPQEDLIEVTVATGTVEFSKTEETAEKVILTKGNSGILKKTADKAVKETKGFSNAVAWKTEEYQFNNFNDVLLSVERYFDVEIEVENKAILNCNFTNAGKLGELDLAILKELIEFQTNNSIQLEQRNERYFLKGEGCK